MPRTENTWEAYIDAAARKILIARFHRDSLAIELTWAAERGDVPSVPIQAHFEGVVTSLMGAVDKVAEATNKASGANWSITKLVAEGFGYLSRLVPDVKQWYEKPLFDDMREIRRLAIHHVHDKRRMRDSWQIEDIKPRGGKSPYGGSRELLEYATACVEFGEGLNKLLPTIRAELSRVAATRGEGMTD